jgi:ribulose-phosphate 3-epimerase
MRTFALVIAVFNWKSHAAWHTNHVEYQSGKHLGQLLLTLTAAKNRLPVGQGRSGNALTRLRMGYGDPRPVQIIPSVLPADWANMGAECKRLEDAGVDRIQFDVMDGNFVPNLTFGPELIAACRKYTKVPFETQLMVSNYNADEMLEQYVKASAGPNGEPGVVIVHVESQVHLHRTLANIRKFGGSPSVALNPHTPAEMIENVLDLVDHVLVMTVNPGWWSGLHPYHGRKDQEDSQMGCRQGSRFRH